LDGLTKRCGPSEIVESKHPWEMSRDTEHYSFTSQMPIDMWFCWRCSDSGLCMNECTLLNQDIALSLMSHGDIESTKSPLLDQGGPNYMHGPLFMQVCTPGWDTRYDGTFRERQCILFSHLFCCIKPCVRRWGWFLKSRPIRELHIGVRPIT
jgi:hypothetical protein